MRRLIFVMMVAMVSFVVVGQPATGDWLLYVEPERVPAGLNAYNPTTGETLELPVFVGTEAIRTSGDGRIAYIHQNDVWVLDVLNAPYDPVNISQTPDEAEVIVDWSLNGEILQYLVGADSAILYNFDGNEVLAVEYGMNPTRHWNENGWYVASNDDGLFVWNGQERIELDLPPLPAEPEWQRFLWTVDNHLFITIGYHPLGMVELTRMSPFGASDLFYWNGEIIGEVGRPSDDETIMLGDWSADGRLTLFTSEDLFDRWYIWDGVSFTAEGVPDASTFTPINGEEDIIDIEWMPDGRLAISVWVYSDADLLLGHPFACDESCTSRGHGVYLWDAESIQEVTYTSSAQLRLDVHESGRIAVTGHDGIRGYDVTVFDTHLQPIFSAYGPHFGSRWSDDGDLAYCEGDGLSVWNGDESVYLSYRTYAKWLLSTSFIVLCSTG